MIEHGVARNGEDMVLQFFQRAHSQYHLVRLWVAEEEVAEAHVFFQFFTQIYAYLL